MRGDEGMEDRNGRDSSNLGQIFSAESIHSPPSDRESNDLDSGEPPALLDLMKTKKGAELGFLLQICKPGICNSCSSQAPTAGMEGRNFF